MKNQIVRKNVSNIIAVVCAIEIPRNEWPDIIVNLSKNADNENI